MAAAIVYLAFTALSTAYSIYEAKKARDRAAAAADAAKGYELSIEGSAQPIPIALGRSLVGGVRTFHQTSRWFRWVSDPGVGCIYATTEIPGYDKKSIRYNRDSDVIEVLDRAFPSKPALAGDADHDAPDFLFVEHVISAAPTGGIQYALVDGLPWDHESFKNGIRFWHSYTGDGLVNNPLTRRMNWPARLEAKFPGVSAVGAVYKLNRDDPQFSGNVPEAQFVFDGWLCFDISATNTLITTRTASTNPVRQLLTYLLDTRFGRGVSVENINLPSFKAGIGLCNRIVQTGVAVSGSYWASKGVTTRDLPLFESNQVLDTSKSYRDNINSILDSMIGADLIWSEDQYKFKLQVPRSYAEIVFSGPTLTDDRIIADSVSIKPPDTSSRKNSCTVKFRNENRDFAEDTATWPPVGSALHSTYLAEDAQLPLHVEINVTGVTTPQHATARAEEFVRSSRLQTAYTFSMFIDGAMLEPGDIISVNAPSAGIPAEVLRILEIEVDENNVAKITAVKFQWDTLAWNAKDDEYVAAREYTFDTMKSVENITFSATAGMLGATTGSLSWTLGVAGYDPDEFIIHTASTTTLVGETPSWSEVGRTSGDRLVFELPALRTGSYVFSVTPSRRGLVGTPYLSAAFSLTRPDLYLPDLTPPPKPPAFTLTSRTGEIQVTLPSAPAYTNGHGHGYTEILYNTVASGQAGTVRGSFSSASGSCLAVLGLGIAYRVWLRFVSKDNVGGPLSDPVDVTVSQIVSNDIANQAIGRTKFAASIEPIEVFPGPTIPATKTTSTIFVNGKLYRWNGSAYTASIDASDIPQATLDASKFVSGIEPVTLVTSGLLPTTKSTGVILYGNELYRWNGAAYVKSVAAADISGTVSASQIAAVVGANNLVLNSSFEADSLGWTLPSGATLVNTTNAMFGTRVLQQVNASATDNPVTQTLSLRPRTTYRISGYRRIVSVTGGAFSDRLVGVITDEISAIATSSTITSGAWVRFSVTLNTPSTVTNARLVLYGVVGTTMWDAIQITEGDLLTSYSPRVDEILPGSVGSNELAANSVVAAKIAAGAVVADKLAANAVTADKIAANAVTADKILAGSVTATKLAANSVTAGVIAAGAVSANAIAAGSVNASHVRIGDFTNLILNPDGLLDNSFSKASGWSSDIAAAAPESSLANWWPAYVNSRSTITFFARDNYAGQQFACKPGDQFYASGYGVVSGGGAAQTQCSLTMFYYGTSGGLIHIGVMGTFSGTGVLFREGFSTAPAGTMSAVFVVWMNTDSPAAPYHLDHSQKAWHLTKLFCGRRATGNLIVDGAITADKLSANAVTAGKIAAGAVGADQIAARSIAASHLMISDLTNLCHNRGMQSDGWITSLGYVPEVADHLGYLSNAGLDARFAIHINTRDTYYGGFFPVQFGEEYAFSWSTFPGDGGTSSQPAAIGLHLQTEAGSETWVHACLRPAGTPGLLTQTGSLAIPDGFAKARVCVQLPNNMGTIWTDPSQRHWATNIEVRRRNNGHLIVDGAITANKMSVGSLSAITANVGLLRTAASGNRVEIESNQIRVYDGNNLLRVVMGVF